MFRQRSHLRSVATLGVGALAALAFLAPCGAASTGRSVAFARNGGTIGATERARLRGIVLPGALRFGDAHPTNLQAVATTYTKYRQQFGGPPVNAGAIYVIEMQGHFKLPVPGGRSFSYDVVIVNATTNTRILGLLVPSYRKLSLLGPVTPL
jgi:hypothetical protein